MFGVSTGTVPLQLQIKSATIYTNKNNTEVFMKAQLIGKNQIRAFISPEEIAERGINLDTATYQDLNIAALINDVLHTLKDQVDEHTFKMPHRTEVIPVSDGGLILLITWSAEEREYLSEKGATFTPPPVIPGDPNASGNPPYALPIDELQASVMADIISALSTGDLKEHLKRYLNEDFLEEVLRAASASGLEDMLSSFLSESGTDVEQVLTDLLDPDTSDKAASPRFTHSSGQKTKKAVSDCICVTFKSISEAERALSASGLKNFKGGSMFFKSGSRFILALSPGKLSRESFEEAVKTFQTLYNGERRPEAYIAYLAEHEKTIVGKDAVGVLLGG